MIQRLGGHRIERSGVAKVLRFRNKFIQLKVKTDQIASRGVQPTANLFDYQGNLAFGFRAEHSGEAVVQRLLIQRQIVQLGNICNHAQEQIAPVG